MDQKSSQNEAQGVLQDPPFYPKIFWSAILLGLIYNYLFVFIQLGLSYFLFVLSFYIVFWWVFWKRINKKWSYEVLLTIPIIALSATFFLFSNQIFWSINFVLVPLLIIAQTLLLFRNNLYPWWDICFPVDVLNAIFTRSFPYFQNFFLSFRLFFDHSSDKSKFSIIGKILLGLLASIPLLFVIIGLLRSADIVFDHYFLLYLKNINFIEWFFRFFIILIVSSFAFSFMWSFHISKRNLQNDLQVTNLSAYPFLDPTVYMTVLFMINLVYLAFGIIQFTYLFGAFNNGLPEGMTYSMYAREGFFQLIFVTIINFILVIFGIKFLILRSKKLALLNKIVLSLTFIFTGILLYSAHLRMLLYEEVYSYTYLRVLTHSFIFFLAILLVIIFFKIWSQRIALLKSFILIGLLAYIGINYFNIDAFIAEKNLARSLKIENNYYDAYYLNQLSYDAIPIILSFYQKHQIPEDLYQMLLDKRSSFAKDKRDWRSFNLSVYNAKNALFDIFPSKP